MRRSEPRTETGSELFACQHSIHSYVKQQIRSLPVASKVQKRCMLKLPNKSLECFAKLAVGFCDEVLPYFKIKNLVGQKTNCDLLSCCIGEITKE